MSSISANSFDPRSLLQQQLLSQISSGKVNSADKDALSSALDDIDSALKGEASGGSRPPSPDKIQSKISDLISDEVKSGKLTSDQANELETLFSSTFGKSSPLGAPSSGQSSTAKNADDLIADFLKTIQKSQASYSLNGANNNSSQASLLFDYQA